MNQETWFKIFVHGFVPTSVLLSKRAAVLDWKIFYVAPDNRGGSISQEGQWADFLGFCKWEITLLLSTTDFFSCRHLWGSESCLCSHPLLLMSKYTLSLHMPREKQNFILMPKRLSSCQGYSANTHSLSMATWRCCLGGGRLPGIGWREKAFLMKPCTFHTPKASHGRKGPVNCYSQASSFFWRRQG